MSPSPDDPSAPLNLGAFSADARALGEADFAARHGGAFLLHEGNLDPSRRPIQPQQTLIMGRVLPADAGGAPARASGSPVSSLRIYPVRHTGRSPFPRIVTVGRTKNNDVVLADVSISKFHAFFKEEGGTYFLADGESRNGTFVDGERALSTKQGKPTMLRPGARVKFGAIEFRFIDMKELLSLARQFG
jgi:hypothetical protein